MSHLHWCLECNRYSRCSDPDCYEYSGLTIKCDTCGGFADSNVVEEKDV